MEAKLMKCIYGNGPGVFPSEGEVYKVREYGDPYYVEVWNEENQDFSNGWFRTRFVEATEKPKVLPPHEALEMFRKATEQPVSAKATQVGGTHYTKQGIQPYEYTLANGLGGLEHTVVKYVTRWKDKGGVEDLKKARHTLDFLIEYTEKNNA